MNEYQLKKAAPPKPPSLAEMRKVEEEAQKHLKAMGEHAKAMMAAGMIKAIGYRVLVKPITVKRTLESGEAMLAPTLAERGFETKSEKARLREERGENHGVVVDVGPEAYKKLGEPWVAVGDVVIYSRYAGTRIEHPPGSNNFFQMVNDEDIFGKIV